MFRQLIRGYSKSFVAAARASTRSVQATPGAGAGTGAGSQKPLASIAVYHNPSSPLSMQLLAKLRNYSSLPCTTNKHKQDLSKSVTSSPTGEADVSKYAIDLRTNQRLTFADYEFIVNECADIHPHNTQIVRRLLNAPKHAPFCVSDYHKLGEPEFPIIIDYTHKLVANDEQSFDRILQHYLSCGIQDSTNVRWSHPETKSNSVRVEHTLVHPHVAEFADLF